MKADTCAIHRKETTESTNADARAGRPGEVFIAEFQTAGRGRLDHRWLAPPGMNLTFSVVLDAAGRPLADVATMPLVAGLAVVRAVRRLLQGACTGNAPELKWPNDVLVKGRKLAGLLCELNGENVIAGIGLNVNQTVFAPELAARATSLALLAGRPFDRDAALHAVLDELFAVHEIWQASGFAALHREFAAIDHLSGRMVAVMQTDSDDRPVSGICGGIQPDGTLLVGGERIFAGEAHVVPIREGMVSI